MFFEIIYRYRDNYIAGRPVYVSCNHSCRDFNLEKKIEALPSLSLEEFQEKKKQQRTKKKKILQKVNSSTNKRHQNNPSSSGQTNSQTRRTNAANENSEESEKAHLVGSQKRKARKQSITRNAAAINSAKQSENQEANKCELRIISSDNLRNVLIRLDTFIFSCLLRLPIFIAR